VAKLDGGLMCRRMVRVNGVVPLETATAAPQREICGEDRPLEVWGVVSYEIHPMQV
jgi:hypothetical protein